MTSVCKSFHFTLDGEALQLLAQVTISVTVGDHFANPQKCVTCFEILKQSGVNSFLSYRNCIGFQENELRKNNHVKYLLEAVIETSPVKLPRGRRLYSY
jgi:hypothetical protein